jgi:hypothetical protein
MQPKPAMNTVRKVMSLRPDLSNRFMVREDGRISGPYTVDELEMLARPGKLTKGAELARADANGRYDFSPITRWPVAGKLFPASVMKLAEKIREPKDAAAGIAIPTTPKVETLKGVLTEPVISAPVQPAPVPVPTSAARREGGPFTSRDEIDALLATDAHHPAILQLQENIRAIPRREGISANDALDRILTDNAKRLERIATAAKTPRVLRGITQTQSTAVLAFLMCGGTLFGMIQAYPGYNQPVVWAMLGLAFIATVFICKFGDPLNRSFLQLPWFARLCIKFLIFDVAYTMIFATVFWAMSSQQSYWDILRGCFGIQIDMLSLWISLAPFTPVQG